MGRSHEWVRRVAFAAMVSVVIGCGGRQQPASEARAASEGEAQRALTRADVLRAAEAAVREAVRACPAESVRGVAARVVGDEAGTCPDAAAAASERARAISLLTLASGCAEDDAGCLEAAGPLPPGEPATPSATCGEERVEEEDGWRTAAIAISASATIDCQIAGGGEPGSCGSLTASVLNAAALGALEISGRAGGDSITLLDATTTVLQSALEAGSVGAGGPWLGPMIAQAVTRTLTASACVNLPHWQAGEGLVRVAVEGTRFSLALPAGSQSPGAGIALVPGARPIRVGFSAAPLRDLISSAPPECRPLEAELEAAAAWDCVGPELYVEHRELWLVADLGAVRAVVVARERHDAAPVVVQATLTLLRSVALVEPSADDAPWLDVAQLAAPGAPGPFAIVVRTDAEDLQLADRIAPGRGQRELSLTFDDDASMCTRGRDFHLRAGRVVVAEVATPGSTCEVAVQGESTLFVLRAVPAGQAFAVLQLIQPISSAEAAEAALAEARGLLDVIAPAPAP